MANDLLVALRATDVAIATRGTKRYRSADLVVMK